MKIFKERLRCRMLTQTYRSKEIPELNQYNLELERMLNEKISEKHGQIEILGHQKAKCEEFGLKQQAVLVGDLINQLKTAAEADVISPKSFYPEISYKEAIIWEVWLPCRYSETRSSQGRTLREYSFDQIPLEVLEEWDIAKQLQLFKSFAIMTPETKVPDPILIGIGKDGREYLIARWGESLMPFEEIENLVQKYFKRVNKVNKFGVVYLIFWAALSIFLSYNFAAQAVSQQEGLPSKLIGGTLCGTLFFVMLCVIGIWLGAKLEVIFPPLDTTAYLDKQRKIASEAP
jgi:hypothetical protein